MSLVDRTNISNAYISGESLLESMEERADGLSIGMAVDLNIIHGVGYSVSTLVFFPP